MTLRHLLLMCLVSCCIAHAASAQVTATYRPLASAPADQRVTSAKPRRTSETDPLAYRAFSKKMKTLHGKPTPGWRLSEAHAAHALQMKNRAATASAAKVPVRRLQANAGTATSPGLALRPQLNAGNTPSSVATGDFDGDGHMDIAEANVATNEIWTYRGHGDGTFDLPRVVPLTQGLAPVYLVAADLRGTGVLDLIVANVDSKSVGVLLGNGDGTFGYESMYELPDPPSALEVGDFNHDGKLDVVATQLTTNEFEAQIPYIVMLPGDGTGNLGAPVITYDNSFFGVGFFSSATAISAADVNGDGLPDVLVTGPYLENSVVYLNAGDGTFTLGQVIVENGPFTFLLDGRLADMDHDGCVDAVAVSLADQVYFSKGDCHGHFADPQFWIAGESHSALRLVDVDGDGNLDVVTTSVPAGDLIYGDLGGSCLTVLFGDGTGNFKAPRVYRGGGASTSLAAADFNEDGRVDFVTAIPATDSLSLYFNQGNGFGFPEGVGLAQPGGGTINAPQSALDFLDMNGDKTKDIGLLTVGADGNFAITTILNDGNGRFSDPHFSPLPTGGSVGDHRFADFRNSGHPDFVLLGQDAAFSESTQRIIFAAGNGDGTFASATDVNAAGADGTLAVGDFNRDGFLDFVAVGANPNVVGAKLLTLFLGRGDGTFHAGSAISFADDTDEVQRVFSGDYNGDGKLDVLVFGSSNGYWTLRSDLLEFLGNGDGTFQGPIKLFEPFQPMTLSDLNGDGHPDIVQYDFRWPDGTSETEAPPRFTTYLGQTDGTFHKTSSYSPYFGVPASVAPFLQTGDPTGSSLSADLNGDGKPEALAFHTPSIYDPDALLQILAGNGDGTLTATNDIFDLQKPYVWPKYEQALDGSGMADLVELDGEVSSLHVIKPAPAPSLQIALEQSQASGAGCGWVYPNLASSSTTVVSLRSGVAGINLPASVAIPPNALGERFCFTLANGYDWHQVYDVQATLGTDTAVAYGSQAYNVGFTFDLSTSVATAPFYDTQATAAVPVAITPEPGFSGTVALSCSVQVPGVTCAFASDTLDLSQGAVATSVVFAADSKFGGSQAPVVVVATGAMVSKRQFLTLNVAQLNISFTPGVPLPSPGSGDASVIVNGIPPYSLSCFGLPPGVSCSFTGDAQAYPQATSYDLHLIAGSGLVPGVYNFSVMAESSGLTQSAPALFIVAAKPDFSISEANPIWALPGGTVMQTVQAAPINQFTGTVSWACTTDWGGVCSASPSDVGPGTASVPLSITVATGVSLGDHQLTLTGMSGALSHTVALPIAIADYNGALDTKSLSLSRGSFGKVHATLTTTAGFSDEIALSCSAPSQLTCTISPAMVSLNGVASSTSEVLVEASLQANLKMRTPSDTWLLAIVCFGFIGGVSLKARVRFLFAGLVWAAAILGIALLWSACGGGTSPTGGGGAGSNSYTVMIVASAANSGTTRVVGSVTVSVSH